MKKIYEKENLKKTMFQIQKRFIVFYSKKFEIKEIICAFNELSGRNQDLLLTHDRDEDEKILVQYAYSEIESRLFDGIEVPNEVKIKIKNLNQEKSKKKKIELEECEIEGGVLYRKPKLVLEKGKEIKKED